jgi:hypothetical protein
MTAPILPVRTDRATAIRPSTVAASVATADDGDLTAAQKALIATQHAAFDYEIAERAEILRESDAMETLVMQELKNEDEFMKKWIALI